MAATCQAPPRACPACVDGSDYTPVRGAPPHPAATARAAARRATRAAQRATPAARLGRAAKRKGTRLEQEIARVFQGLRVPYSGMLDGFPNDVLIPAPGRRPPAAGSPAARAAWYARHGWRTEVKGRADAGRLLYRAVAQADVAAVREPGGPWLFVVPAARWQAGGDPALAPWAAAPTATVLASGLRCAVLEHARAFGTIWRWLTHEAADVLLFKADRRGWLVICDAAHLTAWAAAVPAPAPAR